MELEELKERYKLIPMWGRLSIAFIVGLLPGVYTYFEEGETLTLELEAKTAEQAAAQTKFDNSVAKKKKIPQIEERLAELEEQLAKARKALPDTYRIEEILQKTALVAKETGVKVTMFKPEQEVPSGTTVRYMEMPILTHVEGKYNQVAAFYDRLVHLEHSLFVRDIDLSTAFFDREKKDRNAPMEVKSDFQKAKELRQDLYIKSKLRIVIYRSMTDAESAMGGPVTQPQGQVGNVPPPPQPAANVPPPPPAQGNQQPKPVGDDPPPPPPPHAAVKPRAGGKA